MPIDQGLETPEGLKRARLTQSPPGPRAHDRHRILIVDDDPVAARALKDLVEFMDAPAVLVASPEDWRERVGGFRLAALFMGRSVDADAQAGIVDALATIDRNVPVVVCGSGGAGSGFPAWLRLLELPDPRRIDELNDVLEEIWALTRAGRKDDTGSSRGSRLIGGSADMRMIRALIERVAPSQATVLITGESGTGKEVIARQIHEQSGQRGEFVAINCGAIPDHLLESELFGHEKGAFTGARAARAGRFELACGGTLFLDEIGDMPTAMQVKLLRVLQERVIERVGGTKSIPVDLRIVAATHRDLPQRIEEGLFREDLFYRLSVFPIEVTPLRKRQEDVEPLVEELVERVASRYGICVRFTPEALSALREYEWPGNVRELANLVERLAVIYPQRPVDVDDLPGALSHAAPSVVDDGLAASEPAAALPPGGLDLKKHLAGLERDMIAAALREADGVVQKAAESLGLGRTTLVEKIRRHDLRD